MENVKLPDTSWHIGYVKKDENDPRRHKSRCIYNNGKHCSNSHMLYCQSSAHCRYYAETWTAANKYKREMQLSNMRAGIILSRSVDIKKDEIIVIKNIHDNNVKTKSELDKFMNLLKRLTRNQKRRMIYYRYSSSNVSIHFSDYFRKYNFDRIMNNTFTEDDIEIKILYNFYNRNKKLLFRKLKMQNKLNNSYV
ncbi:MAG: hypothetical protein J5798_07635 [Spirochaetaceae bacterium]|nr:hypothetical protein [Spirochaetaceae bacterium]